MTELLSHHWCTGKLIFDFATHIWPDQEMTAMSHYDFVKFEQRYLAKWRETELTVADKDLEVNSQLQIGQRHRLWNGCQARAQHQAMMDVYENNKLQAEALGAMPALLASFERVNAV